MIFKFWQLLEDKIGFYLRPSGYKSNHYLQNQNFSKLKVSPKSSHQQRKKYLHFYANKTGTTQSVSSKLAKHSTDVMSFYLRLSINESTDWLRRDNFSKFLSSQAINHSLAPANSTKSEWLMVLAFLQSLAEITSFNLTPERPRSANRMRRPNFLKRWRYVPSITK